MQTTYTITLEQYLRKFYSPFRGMEAAELDSEVKEYIGTPKYKKEVIKDFERWTDTFINGKNVMSFSTGKTYEKTSFDGNNFIYSVNQ